MGQSAHGLRPQIRRRRLVLDAARLVAVKHDGVCVCVCVALALGTARMLRRGVCHVLVAAGALPAVV